MWLLWSEPDGPEVNIILTLNVRLVKFHLAKVFDFGGLVLRKFWSHLFLKSKTHIWTDP